MILVFDIVDACNLKCVSCYRGINGNQKTKLNLDTLEKSLTHVVNHFEIKGVWPNNWSEPFLAKNLPDYLMKIREFDLPIALSSSLNLAIKTETFEKVLPLLSSFNISASGLDQGVYSKYHKGGNITKVLENITKMLDVKNRLGLEIPFDWTFGKHLYNTDQYKKIAQFCEKNNIRFVPTRYYITDIKDVLKVVADVPIAEEIYSLFYSSQKEAKKDILQYAQPDSCYLLNGNIVIDHKGNLMICCGSIESTNTPIQMIKNKQQLDEIRLQNSTCMKCYKKGFANYFRGTRSQSRLERFFRNLFNQNIF